MNNKELEKKVEELERMIKKYFETPVKGERQLTIDDIEVGQQFKYCGHTYTKLNEENFCIIDDFDSDFMYCIFDPITNNYDESIIRQYINSDRFIERLGVNKGAIKKCINVFENYAKEIEALEEVKPKALKDYSWKKISEISKAGIAEKYFSIGDEKEVELYTGERVTVVILGFCHDDLADSSAKAGITFGLKTNIDGEFEMNENNTNKGGWKESKMRNTYMQRFFKLLPLELKRSIVEVKKLTSAGNESEEIIETVDKIFLFSEVECTGDTEYSVKGEGEQYKYFKENGFSTGRWFWLRSPYSGSSTYFCSITNLGYIYYYYASTTYSARLGFCL